MLIYYGTFLLKSNPDPEKLFYKRIQRSMKVKTVPTQTMPTTLNRKLVGKY